MKSYTINAVHLASVINLKQIKLEIDSPPIQHNAYELIYRLDDFKYIFIYNFGSIVFFNIDKSQQNEYLQIITDYLQKEPREINTEDFIIKHDPNLDTHHLVGFNLIQLRHLTFEQLNLVCMNIGESTALEYFENATEGMLEKSNEISKQLRETGSTNWSRKEIIKYIGQCLYTKQRVTSDLFVYDQPDITWEDQNLSRLYDETKRLFEIESRYKSLEYKLKLIQESVEITMDLLNYNSQTLLEIIVILLIAIEVIYFLYEKTPSWFHN